jgi:predicted aldo/keto reductase-like oxidoreductase
MYARSYDNRERARHYLKKIPEKQRQQMLRLDYSSAEKKCPQKMAIGKLMQEALNQLS